MIQFRLYNFLTAITEPVQMPLHAVIHTLALLQTHTFHVLFKYNVYYAAGMCGFLKFYDV